MIFVKSKCYGFIEIYSVQIAELQMFLFSLLKQELLESKIVMRLIKRVILGLIYLLHTRENVNAVLKMMLQDKQENTLGIPCTQVYNYISRG